MTAPAPRFESGDRVRVDWADLESVAVSDVITARAGLAAELSYARFELAAEAEVPMHSHDNEEFGFVISGSLELWTGDTHERIGSGESFIIRRGTSHRAVAGPHGCDLLECYAPPRDPIAAQRLNPPRRTNA